MWQGCYWMTGAWSRHVRNSNSGVQGILKIQFFFESPDSSSLVTFFFLMQEKRCGFSSQHRYLPLQAIWHILYSRDCQKKIKQTNKKTGIQEVWHVLTNRSSSLEMTGMYISALVRRSHMHCYGACVCMKREGWSEM